MAIVFIQALPLEWYSQSDFTNLHFFLIKRHMVMSTVNICTYGVPQWSWVCFCIKRHNIIKFVVCLCWMFKFVIYVFKCSISGYLRYKVFFFCDESTSVKIVIFHSLFIPTNVLMKCIYLRCFHYIVQIFIKIGELIQFEIWYRWCFFYRLWPKKAYAFINRSLFVSLKKMG